MERAFKIPKLKYREMLGSIIVEDTGSEPSTLLCGTGEISESPSLSYPTVAGAREIQEAF